MFTKPVWALLAAACDCDASQCGVVKGGRPQPPITESLVAGTHHTITLDCAGGSARIAGSHNDVTLTGRCTRLSIYGAWNKVTVSFASGRPCPVRRRRK